MNAIEIEDRTGEDDIDRLVADTREKIDEDGGNVVGVAVIALLDNGHAVRSVKCSNREAMAMVLFDAAGDVLHAELVRHD